MNESTERPPHAERVQRGHYRFGGYDIHRTSFAPSEWEIVKDGSFIFSAASVDEAIELIREP